MKSDLKINYGVLRDIRDSVSIYKTALENMKTSVATIDEAISNSSGEAVSALNEKVEDFSSEMSSCGTELQDLETVIDGFITKMTEFIKPVVEDKMMRVDSTDISCNMDSIISACEYVQNLPSKVGTWVAKSEFASMASEEKIRAEENNDAKLAEIRWLIYNTYIVFINNLNYKNGGIL